MPAKKKTKQKEIERNYEIRYSVLSELLYFDPARMCMIDPIQNLLLGTVKTCLMFESHLKF